MYLGIWENIRARSASQNLMRLQSYVNLLEVSAFTEVNPGLIDSK